MKPKLSAVNLKDTVPLSRVEVLAKAYSAVEESSRIVVEDASQTLFETSDPEKTMRANRAIRKSDNAINDALFRIIDQRSSNLNDVHIKLNIWHENIVGSIAERSQLSPMEQLLCSAYDDILQLIKEL